MSITSILRCLSGISFCAVHIANAQSPQPIFRNGEAQIVQEFSSPENWIKEELWVETSFDSDGDGRLDRMHVFITRPVQTANGDLKLPAVYTSSPYYGLKLWALLGLFDKKYNWNVKHEIGESPKEHKHPNRGTRDKRPFMAFYMDNTWVPRGYVMVYSSSPGTGLSDGAPTVGGENESLAPKAVIDWLCGRAKGYSTRTGNAEVFATWCTGKVGMTGTSYDGTLCIAAATTGVEGLEAIIPVAPVTSFYQYYRSNGLVRSPGGYLGEDIDVLYDFIHTGLKANRKRNDREIRDSILVKNQDRITGDYNAFWASRDYLNQIDNMHAAMLMSHGFNDWNVMTEQSYRFYVAAKEKGLPVQLYYHQQDHGGDPPMTMMNRWFTHYLHGVDNGVEKDAPVQIVREFETTPTAYPMYPDSLSEQVTFYLQADNSNTGLLQLTPTVNNQNITFTDDYHFSGQDLATATSGEHRLLCLSPVLEKELRISGTAQISLRLASNKPAANLSVWLVALPWEDEKTTAVYENIITRGWADPQNHQSISEGQALIPGNFYQVSFELMPDDQIIPAGQQLGLLIFSSDSEFTLLPDPGTSLTIDLYGSSFSLPIVGGQKAYVEAVRK